jgi:hypothetical protein
VPEADIPHPAGDLGVDEIQAGGVDVVGELTGPDVPVAGRGADQQDGGADAAARVVRLPAAAGGDGGEDRGGVGQVIPVQRLAAAEVIADGVVEGGLLPVVGGWRVGENAQGPQDRDELVVLQGGRVGHAAGRQDDRPLPVAAGGDVLLAAEADREPVGERDLQFVGGVGPAAPDLLDVDVGPPPARCP